MPGSPIMRKVLITSHTFAPERNGVAGVVEAVALGLLELGWSVDIATCAVAGSPESETYRGLRVFRFELQGNGATGVVGELERFHAFLRTEAYGRYLTNGVLSWATDLILDCPSIAKSDVVLVSHGFSSYENPGLASYHSELFRKCRELRAVVCLSDRLSDYFHYREAGLKNVRVISNGVYSSKWAGGDGAGRETPYVVNISNHNPLKGHGLYAELAGEIGGVQFRQVGTGYRAAKWSLGRIGVMGGCWYACKIRALGGRVRYLDGSNRETVHQGLAGSLMKVLTSSWEAAPLVLLEAMAAGKAWVSTDVGCVRSWPGGVVCASKAEMGAAVRKLLEDPARRAALGQEGREAAQNVYDWRQIVKIYSDVLA